MPTGGKRAKREPVDDVIEEEGEEAEARLEEEFPINAEDGYAVPLVCRDASEYYSVMGVLFWSHYNSLEAGITRFFDTREACVLRLVHSEFKDAVSATPWCDLSTIIVRSAASWRECFGLRAQAACVSIGVLLDNDDLEGDVFRIFRGLDALVISDSDHEYASWVTEFPLLDEFANLRGISTLILETLGTFQVGAFYHLKGIQELRMLNGFDRLDDAERAAEHVRGARSTLGLVHSEEGPFATALDEGDAEQCRRLLTSCISGSASWMYAGVTFHDVAAPSTSSEIIATACVELLQAGIVAESAGMMEEAAVSIGIFIRTGARDAAKVAACIVCGAAPALVATLRVSSLMDFQARVKICEVLGEMATVPMANRACIAADAVPAIVTVLTRFQQSGRSPFYHPYEVLCVILGRMATTQVGATACSRQAEYATSWRVFRDMLQSILMRSACFALQEISSFHDGRAACLAANAAPCLVTVLRLSHYARDEARAALRNLRAAEYLVDGSQEEEEEF